MCTVPRRPARNSPLRSTHGAGVRQELLVLLEISEMEGKRRQPAGKDDHKRLAVLIHTAQITLGVNPSPQILPALLIDRRSGPALMLAASVQQLRRLSRLSVLSSFL